MKNRVMNNVINALWAIKLVILLIFTINAYSTFEWGWLFVWGPEIAMSWILIMRQIDNIKKLEEHDERIRREKMGVL